MLDEHSGHGGSYLLDPETGVRTLIERTLPHNHHRKVPMALLLRKRLIVIETESSYGTDASPDGADAVLVRDLSITPQSSDVVSRDLIRPYLGASQQLLANTRVECTFSVEMAGSGTAGTAPAIWQSLKACGLAETVASGTSVTYDPVSSSFFFGHDPLHDRWRPSQDARLPGECRHHRKCR